MPPKVIDIQDLPVIIRSMPARQKFHDRVGVAFQMERKHRDNLRCEVARRNKGKASKDKISFSDLLNERLKSPVSHIISLVK